MERLIIFLRGVKNSMEKHYVELMLWIKNNWLVIQILFISFLTFVLLGFIVVFFSLRLIKNTIRNMKRPFGEKCSIINYYRYCVDVLELEGYGKYYDETPIEYAKRIDRIIDIDFENVTRIYLREKSLGSASNQDVDKMEAYVNSLCDRIERRNPLWKSMLNVFNMRYCFRS